MSSLTNPLDSCEEEEAAVGGAVRTEECGVQSGL